MHARPENMSTPWTKRTRAGRHFRVRRHGSPLNGESHRKAPLRIATGPASLARKAVEKTVFDGGICFRWEAERRWTGCRAAKLTPWTFFLEGGLGREQGWPIK
jgi:hypothetical protein